MIEQNSSKARKEGHGSQSEQQRRSDKEPVFTASSKDTSTTQQTVTCHSNQHASTVMYCAAIGSRWACPMSLLRCRRLDCQTTASALVPLPPTLLHIHRTRQSCTGRNRVTHTLSIPSPTQMPHSPCTLQLFLVFSRRPEFAAPRRHTSMRRKLRQAHTTTPGSSPGPQPVTRPEQRKKRQVRKVRNVLHARAPSNRLGAGAAGSFQPPE